MNGLEHQEQRMWEDEVNRMNEIFKDYSDKEKEIYIRAYNDAVRFVVQSDECLGNGVDLSNFLVFSD